MVFNQETGQQLPAQVAKIQIHSDLTPQTTFLSFASWSALVPGGHGPLLMPLSYWCALVIPAVM